MALGLILAAYMRFWPTWVTYRIGQHGRLHPVPCDPYGRPIPPKSGPVQ